MKHIEVAWIREGDHLILGSDIENLLGWTAEEAEAQPLESLMTPETWNYFKENYYRGPPDRIAPRVFFASLVHRDGHIVYAHVFIVCRYDMNGEMCQASGCARSSQRQHALNFLMDWCENADPEALDTVIHVVETYAAL